MATHHHTDDSDVDQAQRTPDRPFETMEEARDAIWRAVTANDDILYDLHGCASALASLSLAQLEVKAAEGATINHEDRGLDYLTDQLLSLIKALQAWDDTLTAPALILSRDDLVAIAKRDAGFKAALAA